MIRADLYFIISIKKAHCDYVNNVLTESLTSPNARPFWQYMELNLSKPMEIYTLIPRTKQS